MLLALALLAPPDLILPHRAPPAGHADRPLPAPAAPWSIPYAVPTPPLTTFLVEDVDGQFLVYTDPEGNEATRYVSRSTPIRHEASGEAGTPGVPRLTIEDTIGYRVRVDRPGRSLYDEVQSVTLLGGMDPRDFAVTVAAEQFAMAATNERQAKATSPVRSTYRPWDARPVRLDDYPAGLVHRGLSADRWATRQAAQDVLVRMGKRAVPALVRGLGSEDAEVAVRCAGALRAIKYGCDVR